MTIETERFYIFPLTYSQLKKRTENQNEFAMDENIRFVSASMGPEEMDAIQNKFLPILNDGSKNFLFYTMWLIIEKKGRVVVGGTCFHGEPDENGEVEIGYGTESEFKNKGIMSESILGILGWLKTNEEIKSVIAETEKGNIPSVKLLEKCGFTFFGYKGDNLIYRYVIERK